MSRFLHPFSVCSLTIFLFFSCQPYKLVKEEKQHRYTVSSPLHIDVGDKAVYRASVGILGNYFSGLFVIVNADSLYKAGFLSGMGIKFFDMQIDEDGYEIIYCIESFNRKPVLNAMARGLRFMLEDPSKYDGNFYVDKDDDIIYRSADNDGWKRQYYLENGRTKQITGRRFIRNMVLVELYNNRADQPENIIFLHKGMRLRIEMKKL